MFKVCQRDAVFMLLESFLVTGNLYCLCSAMFSVYAEEVAVYTSWLVLEIFYAFLLQTFMP